MGRKKTHQQFVSELAKVDPAIKVKGQYIGADNRIEVRCDVCGHEWSSRSANLLRGYGCPKCSAERSAAARRKSHEQFLSEAVKKNTKVNAIGVYSDAKSPILVQCKKCGTRWTPRATDLLSGASGCAKCAGVKKKTHEEFVAKLAEVTPNLEVVGQYVNTRTKIAVRCRECGNEKEVLAGSLLRGHSCCKCNRKHS